jgi:uncharacterized protein YdaU (DUF1376 family)
VNYYEHHLGDWAAATGHLSWDEDMAYTRLLRAYYHAEKPIPEGQQYRLAKASTPAQRRAVDAVLAEFFELVDGSFRQKRADEEISRFLDKQRKAKASANARWSQSDRNANASPIAMRTHSDGNAHQTPDTRPNKEREASPLVDRSADDPTNDLPERLPESETPDTPYADLVSAYAMALPQLPQVSVLNTSRKRAMQARWREVCTADKLDRDTGLDWFRWFFGHVASSPFLTGNGKPNRDTGRVWSADFDWLMNPTNFARIVDGRYHRRAQG